MSISYRLGLAVLVILALGDLLTPVFAEGGTPPMSVALIVAALGAASLVLAWQAWTGRRWAAYGLVVLRLISALAAAPALVFDGIPVGVRVAAGVAVAITLLGIALVLGGQRRDVTAVTR